MANVKTWYSEGNYNLSDATTALGTAKSMLWAIKALLVGDIGAVTQGRWTVHGSSDGVTAGLDQVDRWTSSYDATKLVRNAAGAHSWIVLKSPTALGPYYLYIDWNTASDYLWNLSFSKVAPTGGTTTAKPTATDIWAHNASEQFVRNSATPHKVHISRTANGDFFMYHSITGGGRFNTLFAVVELLNTRPGDAYKIATIFDHDRAAFTSIVTTGQQQNGGGSQQSLGSWSVGLSYLRFCSSNGLNNYFGTIPHYAYTAWSASNNPSTEYSIFGTSGIISGSDTEDGYWDFLPMFVIGSNRVKGVLPDCGWVPMQLTEGAMATVALPEKMVVGDALMPWTSTTAPIL